MNDPVEPGPRDEALRALWDAEVMDHPETRAGCPPAHALLSALEEGRGGHDTEAASVLEHVARCAPCREDAHLVRALLEAGGGGASQPAEEAAPGVGVGRGAGNRVFRFPSPLATAATLLLVVGGAGLAWRTLSPGGDALRGGEGTLAAPSATCTEPGVVTVGWSPVEGAEGYQVELFTAEGDLLALGEAAGEAAGEASGDARSLTLLFEPDPGASPPRARIEARFPDGTSRASPATILPVGCTR